MIKSDMTKGSILLRGLRKKCRRRAIMRKGVNTLYVGMPIRRFCQLRKLAKRGEATLVGGRFVGGVVTL